MVKYQGGKITTPGNGESILSMHETVSFADAISTPSTVFTDTQVTINRIRFENTASDGIAGQGELT